MQDKDFYLKTIIVKKLLRGATIPFDIEQLSNIMDDVSIAYTERSGNPNLWIGNLAFGNTSMMNFALTLPTEGAVRGGHILNHLEQWGNLDYEVKHQQLFDNFKEAIVSCIDFKQPNHNGRLFEIYGIQEGERENTQIIIDVATSPYIFEIIQNEIGESTKVILMSSHRDDAARSILYEAHSPDFSAANDIEMCLKSVFQFLYEKTSIAETKYIRYMKVNTGVHTHRVPDEYSVDENVSNVMYYVTKDIFNEPSFGPTLG